MHSIPVMEALYPCDEWGFIPVMEPLCPGDGIVLSRSWRCFILVMESFYPSEGTILSWRWNRFIPVILGTNLKSVLPLKSPPHTLSCLFPPRTPCHQELGGISSYTTASCRRGVSLGTPPHLEEKLVQIPGSHHPLIPNCPQTLLLFPSPWGCFTCLGQPGERKHF